MTLRAPAEDCPVAADRQTPPRRRPREERLVAAEAQDAECAPATHGAPVVHSAEALSGIVDQMDVRVPAHATECGEVRWDAEGVGGDDRPCPRGQARGHVVRIDVAVAIDVTEHRDHVGGQDGLKNAMTGEGGDHHLVGRVGPDGTQSEDEPGRPTAGEADRFR